MTNPRRLSGCLDLAATMLAIAATILLLAFFFNFFPILGLVNNAAHTTGSVVRQYEADGSYYPVISYTPAITAVQTYTAPLGTNPPAFPLGAQVPLLYDRDNYREVRVDQFLYTWTLPLVFGGLAAAAWLLAGSLYFGSRYFARRAHRLLLAEASSK